MSVSLQKVKLRPGHTCLQVSRMYENLVSIFIYLPFCRFIKLALFRLFFHQTMDALDGKQARRAKSGSNLGDLLGRG